MKVERVLLAAGLALFLCGLFAGMAVAALPNPRAGLAAHLEGVMNGTFLMVVGLAWPHVHLGPRTAAVVRALLLLGTWVNFFATELSAILATSRMTPIAGAGFTGEPWAEQLVDVMLISTVPTMVPAVGLLLWGVTRTGRAAA
jgi:hydroxylaminobenzene mutase